MKALTRRGLGALATAFAVPTAVVRRFRPTAPTIIRSVAGQLRWRPPADEGGSAVTGYNVYVDDALVLPARTQSTLTTRLG